MGNKVLRLFLAAWRVVVPNAPTFLAGRRMGVDVSILAYQALAVEDIRAAVYGGNMLPFVAYLKKWATRLLLWGCTPIFVFDSVTGPTFEPKKEEQEKRRSDVLAAMDALQGPLSPEEREKHIKTIVRPTPDLMHLLAEACDDLKVPFLFSPSQTDPQMGALFRAGVIDCAYSPDSDFVAHGVYLLVRKLEYNEVFQNWCCTLFSLANVRNEEKKCSNKSGKVDRLAPLLFYKPNAGSEIVIMRPPMQLAKIFVAAASLGGCDYGSISGIGEKFATDYLKVALVGRTSFTLDELLCLSIDEYWRKANSTRNASGKALALKQVRLSAAAFWREPVFVPPSPQMQLDAPLRIEPSRAWLPGESDDLKTALTLSLELYDVDSIQRATDGILVAGEPCVSLGGPGGLFTRRGDKVSRSRNGYLTAGNISGASLIDIFPRTAAFPCPFFLDYTLQEAFEHIHSTGSIESMGVFLQARQMSHTGEKKVLAERIASRVFHEAYAPTALQFSIDPKDHLRSLDAGREDPLNQLPNKPAAVYIIPNGDTFDLPMHPPEGHAGITHYRVTYGDNKKLVQNVAPDLSPLAIATYFHDRKLGNFAGSKQDLFASQHLYYSFAEVAGLTIFFPAQVGGLLCITMPVKATRQKDFRQPFVWCETSTEAAEFPYISKIVAATCSNDCKVALTGTCPHVALLLKVYSAIPRTGAGSIPTSTSSFCLWNQPAASAFRAAGLATALPRSLPRDIGGPSTREWTGSGLLREHGGRGAVQRLTERELSQPWDAPERVATRSALYAAMKPHIAMRGRSLSEWAYSVDKDVLATIFMTSKQRKRFKRKREMEAAQQAAQGGVQGDDEVDNHAAGPASPVQVAQNPGPAPPNVGDTEMAALGYKRRRQRTQTND